MPKRELTIFRNPDGTITIKASNYDQNIDVRSMTPEQKFEAVREAILARGLVFSEKIEKMARKNLGL